MLHIDRPAVVAQADGHSQSVDHRKMDDLQLFQAFFKQVSGDEMNPDQAGAFTTVVDDLRQAQRESAV